MKDPDHNIILLSYNTSVIMEIQQECIHKYPPVPSAPPICLEFKGTVLLF